MSSAHDSREPVALRDNELRRQLDKLYRVARDSTQRRTEAQRRRAEQAHEVDALMKRNQAIVAIFDND